MKATQNKRGGMMLRWRDLHWRLATASAICIYATTASGAGAWFDYSIQPLRGAAIERSFAIEPIDPARCGAGFGWIETVKSRMDAEALERRLPWRNPIRVRRGSDVEIYRATPKRYGPDTGQVEGRTSATMMVEYTGCVVPAGLVLLSFEADISVDADHAPRRFEVTYEGPPMPIKWRSSETDTMKFKVETDLGDAIMADINLPSSPSFSTDPNRVFWVTLRLQHQGAIE